MVIKELFICLLLIIFLYMFGYPSWKKYQRERTVVSEKFRSVEKIEAPAITICPRNNITSMGWKGGIPKGSKTEWLAPYCGNNQSFENISKCIQENTYGINEVIEVAPGKPSPWNISDWKGQMDITRFGFCYSFNSSVLVGAHQKESFAISLLNKAIYHDFVLHDSHFFMLNANPLTFPKLKITASGNGEIFFFINVIEHTKVKF